ncbi:MAG: hypothetical protein CM15mV53_360 [uncultured marine virus]|nr:MAG: hypothetical protein CM15mV53_360 [uncultured marine virus]
MMKKRMKRKVEKLKREAEQSNDGPGLSQTFTLKENVVVK